MADFAIDGIDLAIRTVRQPDPELEFRKLFDVRPVPLCTQKIRDQLQTPSDLSKQTLIHLSIRRESWPRWLTAVGCAGLHGARTLTFDSHLSALEAAAQGRGIVLGMHPLSWESAAAS